MCLQCLKCPSCVSVILCILCNHTSYIASAHKEINLAYTLLFITFSIYYVVQKWISHYSLNSHCFVRHVHVAGLHEFKITVWQRTFSLWLKILPAKCPKPACETIPGFLCWGEKNQASKTTGQLWSCINCTQTFILEVYYCTCMKVFLTAKSTCRS